MSARSIEECMADVGRALRDPGLSELESAAVASVIVTRRCSFADARAALASVYAQVPADCFQLSTLVTWLDATLSKPRRKPVIVHPPFPRDGSPTNVIRVYTRLTGVATGERVGRIIGQESLREEVKAAARGALHRAVDGKPVANTNDPHLTEAPYWRAKVQGAWVAHVVGARPKGASNAP